MRVVVAGASGFVGHALVAALTSDGVDVRRLVRRAEDEPDAIYWNPAEHELDPAALEGVDVVVNLAGENVGEGRWRGSRRERILRSRVDATSTLVEALSRVHARPKVLLNASAVGFYGDRGEEPLTEKSSIGHGFLPEVCLAWETHAERAAKLGVRTVLLRFGLILGGDGGALAKMLPIFRRGLGGRLGSGQQWMCWITREDVIGVMRFAIDHPECVGPLNVVAPEPVTNAQFTAALAKALRHPAFLPVPAWALQLVFGRMANETMLASVRAVPSRLQELGFRFQHPTIEAALASVV